MKRTIKIIFAVIISIYFLFVLVYHITCDATYKKSNFLGEYKGIEYNGNLYIEGCVAEPYFLVRDEVFFNDYVPKKHYVRQNLFFDFIFPFRYFEFYCESFDDNEIFIINQPNRTDSMYFPFIKENFTYPTIDNNEVAEIWMSQLSNSKDNIKDKKFVTKIVECTKSNGEIELDKCIDQSGDGSIS